MKSKELFLLGLKDSAGIVGAACERAGVSRSTYYRWREEDESFRERADDIIEGQVDFVENRLLKKIQDGDTTAIIFYLKTKGKKRGYSEKAVAAPTGGKVSDNANLLTKSSISMVEKSSISTEKERKLLERKVKNKKAYIVKLLKKQGKYTEELTYQVDITARLLVRADVLGEEVLSEGHRALNVEYSREGNERVTVNPAEKLYLDVLERGQRALRALGMNTESKERKTDNDGYSQFMAAMNEEEE